MPREIERLSGTVLERITPDNKERAKIIALADKLRERVASTSKNLNVEAKVRVEGSVAKDTWLAKEPDIDIFMRVPTTIPRKSLGEVCLKIAREATQSSKQIERFAEHPYLEAIVDSVRVNIVPCYNVERGEWLSATDRTPFHTDYIKKCLKEEEKREVRLLKKFMKGIDVYGAEIKTGGFSGYLCELLTLHYASFTRTLKIFAERRNKIVIDLENYYDDREDDLRLLFKSPFVVVDPVDKGRNVASAVRPQKLYVFMAAARAFLENPRVEFFYPLETVTLSAKELEHTLTRHGSTLISVAFGRVEAVADILWGQLYKSQRSLRKQLEMNGFNVFRGLPWSDEESLNMFIFEVEQRHISSVKKHWGPPLEKREACSKFLNKHVANANTISGPYIDSGRWVVETRREYTDVATLLKNKSKGGTAVGIADRISKTLAEGFKVLTNEEIVEIYEKNYRFARFLTEFLSGRPKWLKSID